MGNITSARDSGVNEVVINPLMAEDLCQRIISVIEDTRPYITAPEFKGPCRRRNVASLPSGTRERREREVHVVKNTEKTLSKAE